MNSARLRLGDDLLQDVVAVEVAGVAEDGFDAVIVEERPVDE